MDHFNFRIDSLEEKQKNKKGLRDLNLLQIIHTTKAVVRRENPPVSCFLENMISGAREMVMERTYIKKAAEEGMQYLIEQNYSQIGWYEYSVTQHVFKYFILRSFYIFFYQKKKDKSICEPITNNVIHWDMHTLYARQLLLLSSVSVPHTWVCWSSY